MTGRGYRRFRAVVDFTGKPVLICPVTVTQTVADLIAPIDTARTLLGHPLAEDYVDPDAAEIDPLSCLANNDPAKKAVGVDR